MLIVEVMSASTAEAHQSSKLEEDELIEVPRSVIVDVVAEGQAVLPSASRASMLRRGCGPGISSHREKAADHPGRAW